MKVRTPFRLFVFGMLLFLISASPAIPQPTQQTARPAAAGPIAIPFELVNRHVVLKVKVNNSRPLSFVLDTGAQFAIINLDLARDLNLKLEGQVKMAGAGAGLSVGSFVRDSTFTIPGYAGFSQPLTLALPLGQLAPRLGQDFDGIVGSEFIKKFVLELDYESRTIILHDKDRFAYTGAGASIPIKLEHGHPIIEAFVTPIGSDPIKGRFVFDIGSGGALALHSPFVTERRLLDTEMKTVKALGAGAGGEITGRIGRVSELKIGKFRISNPVTLFSQDKKGAFASSDLQGNIGAQIAGKFTLFLDYNHDRIIFEPNASFAEPFNRATSGLRVQADGKDYKTFRIADVIDESPASEAGLQKDDIITVIDGRPTADLTLSKLNEMFERAVSYKLTVRRGELTLQVKFTPRRLV